MRNADKFCARKVQDISIATLQEPKFSKGLLEFETEQEAREFLDSLSVNALAALPWLFDFWALPHQRPPAEDWTTWVLMGGRGAGKTRAGSEWVRSKVEGSRPFDKGKCSRIALVGETVDQVREVMIFGESGIMACSPPDRRPKWQASRKRLEWQNGAVAYVVSAADPEALRGPQFDCAWLDELAKWRNAADVWNMLQFTLRLGERPQQLVTTTPRNMATLREILSAEDTVVTRASTEVNRANLAPSYLKKILHDYKDTRLGRQEIDGELLNDFRGAFWNLNQFDTGRLEDAPALDRIVVAVDPPTTSGETADACGIVVAGATTKGDPSDWRGYVLADLTLAHASPQKWAQTVAQAFKSFGADRVVAETNQGGDMVEAVLRQHAPLISYRKVHASRGKVARAEPISALYEQGRIHHVGHFRDLEDEMCQITATGFVGRGSPDRVDALVWALTELMVEPAQAFLNPSIRTI